MDTRTATPTATRSGPADDLSALAWVQDELRRSLDAAHKSLRRYLKESEAVSSSDVDSVDPSVLRSARTQIHQGVGALELVGLQSAALLLRASEAAVQKIIAKPHKLTPALVESIEHASFALLDYLSRMLAGKPVSALALFPQYRAVQEAAGAERIHPADLWNVDWRWRALPADTGVQPRAIDDATHHALEANMLGLMRSPQPLVAAARMSELTAGLGAAARETEVATLWKLAAAVYEANAQNLLAFDVFSKRLASRLLAQYRALEKGETQVSERLAQDLLFFCAQAASPGDGKGAPRLAAVRQAYGLAHHVPVDYSVSPLGRFDPAVIVQARKRVAAAKESWSGVAGGELHRLAGLAEQFSLVGDSLKRLFPLGEAFAAELQMAVAQTQSSGEPPAAPLAMEVATSLLYIEAALEDSEFDHPEQAERVRRLADRLGAVREGRPPEPLEPWMEELYRRVSDRQTMGSVVQELRSSLSESEKAIDQFFRNPDDRQVLIPVPNQLAAMRGVLSVLGMDQATAALLRMRDEIEGLVQTQLDPQRVDQTGLFDRIAGNLGALGFLIDMLSVQPQLAKSLFVFDPRTGTLDPVMGRGPGARQLGAAPPPVEPRLIEQAQQLAFTAARGDVPVAEVARELERLSHEAQAADQGALLATVERSREALEKADVEQNPDFVASLRGELSEALVDFVHTSSRPMEFVPEPPPPPLAAAAPAPAVDSGLAEDDEMREIFLEEAREVLRDAGTARADLAQAPSDLPLQTTVRRAFHTLKGSSRMVGLKEFGEAAWACEQLYNAQLAEHRGADQPLLEFTEWVLGQLAGWVEDIAARRDAARSAAPIKAAAQRLMAGEPPLQSATAAAVAAAPAPAAPAPVAAELPPLPPLNIGLPPDLPSAADLELRDLSAPAAPLAPALAELAFDLDLKALDEPLPAEPVPAAPEGAVLDMQATALQTPFDPLATQPLPLHELPEAALPVPDMTVELIDLDLDAAAAEAPVFEALQPTPVVEADLALDLGAPAEPAAPVPAASPEEENVKVVGPLRIGIPLFNIYLNEADELSRRLTTELAEWAMELHRPVGETPIALAHSLAGSSATVGFNDLSNLARQLEHAQMRSQAVGFGTPDEARLFVEVAEEIRRLLHQFAAGFLKEPDPALLQRLAGHEIDSARRLEAATAAAELPEPTAPAPLPEPAVETITLGAAHEPAAEAPAESTEHIEATAPAPLTGPGFLATSAFGALDSRLDALGQPELKPLAEAPELSQRAHHVVEPAIEGTEDIDAVDAVDAELFPIFEEEGQDLLPRLSAQLRDWARRPGDASHAAACMRTLHTLKGGARLAGAMRLGEMAHRLETRIEQLLAQQPVPAADVEQLQSRGDALAQVFEALRARDAAAYAEAGAALAAEPLPEPPAAPAPVAVAPVLLAVPDAPVAPTDVSAANEPPAAPEQAAAPAPAAAPAEALPPIDWSRFALGGPTSRVVADKTQGAAQSSVRVRAPLLDRLVNQAGEVSITRSRIESEVGQIKGSLGDLTENLERLRQQLRDIELQAETQMSSRLEAAKAASQSFDPLEFDRFTRFQEITRMMAESVNDVATVQRTLQRALDSAEDELATQARLTRDLQDDLLRTRMVEFESLSDRLYRVVRQAAKETGKQVRLDIVGGSIEVDRGVLDRMTGSFEHLLRNSVTHGIESPEQRTGAGKEPSGLVIVSLTQEGNEVGIEFRDDGRGLDLAAIRAKGQASGLLAPDAQPSDAELANLIFTPGFSTAETVTELAGRGVGMDVVRSEVNAMGGRIETATSPGQGTSFRLVLPLTTAVTQVVMLRCGDSTVAVPSTLIEIVRRATPAEVDACYASGVYTLNERPMPFFWLGALLQTSARPTEATGRTRAVVVVRSAQQRVALHVDEVLGNQEVVVKNLGPQLSRLPGLAGMTLLASGAVALIYNPVALATLYGDSARAATLSALQASASQPAQPQQPMAAAPVQAAPLVLVVDDSLTVRRVTQRLLVREGYRVVLAKDGIEALERLAEELPQIVLSDIEMPRMDGFDLVRNIRADARLRALPVIMITSRIAQKHRDYAAELGVDHYLGKPYAEDDLLALIARYTSAAVPA
ncbi:hybrid sensor histidine kinase/response regulator [Piscinibacter defluvii]|uniref:hybrid sensor histidine kinase/response regulator n=1 Tax=Piscinibacter defluvii TaxID=1796922 RepID=UPI000FDECB4D|nr:Hpt domain-containing protein [Piscinibacter defluvii]